MRVEWNLKINFKMYVFCLILPTSELCPMCDSPIGPGVPVVTEHVNGQTYCNKSVLKWFDAGEELYGGNFNIWTDKTNEKNLGLGLQLTYKPTKVVFTTKLEFLWFWPKKKMHFFHFGEKCIFPPKLFGIILDNERFRCKISLESSTTLAGWVLKSFISAILGS